MFFNEQFDLSAVEMSRLGVFNPEMGKDSELFIDAKLLDSAKEEFSSSHEALKGYFADTIYLLKISKHEGDSWWIKARDRTMARERASAGIGYSKDGKSGNGIGKILAGRIVNRAIEIMPHAEFNPDIFELMGIFAEGLGCDRLSDMIVAVLAERFLAYTARVSNNLGIHQLKSVEHQGKEYLIPEFSKEQGSVLLIPKKILKALPIAADIAEALENADLNDDMRTQLNAIVAAAAKNKRSPTKGELQQFIVNRPNLYKGIMAGYEAAVSKPYDFESDIRGVGDTKAVARELIGNLPQLNSELTPPERIEGLLADLLLNLQKLVVENRLSDLLFNDDGSPRYEVMAQRLIHAISEIFAKQYDVDVNREPNAGNGPVDFKFSVGRSSRLLIEVKLSTNPRIVAAFHHQLPAYAASEGIRRLVLLVIQVDDTTDQIEGLRSGNHEGSGIQIEVIDARRKLSASKRG